MVKVFFRQEGLDAVVPGQDRERKPRLLLLCTVHKPVVKNCTDVEAKVVVEFVWIVALQKGFGLTISHNLLLFCCDRVLAVQANKEKVVFWPGFEN